MALSLDWPSLSRLITQGGLSLATILLFIIAGSILCIIPTIFTVDLAGQDTNKLVLISIGTAILSGRVITAIIFIGQFAGVFKEAVREVMYEKEFLRHRQDLTSIWRNVTDAVFTRRFEEVSDKMIDHVERTFDRSADYYQENFEKELRIFWHDRAKGILRIQDRTRADIKPAADRESFDYKFEWKPDYDAEHAGMPRAVLEGMWAGGAKVTHSTKMDLGVEIYSVPFKNNGAKRIERIRTIYLSLATEPWLKITLVTFCLNARVRVLECPPELNMRLISLNTARIFAISGAAGASSGGLDCEFSGLLSPGQGYILVFLLRSSVDADAN